MTARLSPEPPRPSADSWPARKPPSIVTQCKSSDAKRSAEAWLDGYCAAAIVAALPNSHARRKSLLAIFWKRLRESGKRP